MSISEADTNGSIVDGSLLRNPSVSSAKSETNGVVGCVDDAEYAMQLLGFTPKTFSDGLYNACVDYFADHLESALSNLRTQIGVSRISEDELKQAITNIYTSAIPKFDSSFDKLETYLQDNVFNVSNMLLEEDQLHVDYPVVDADIKIVQQSIEEIKQKILATKYVKARLVDELEESVPAMEAVSKLLETQRQNNEILKSTNGIVEKVQAGVDILKKLDKGLDLFPDLHEDSALVEGPRLLCEEEIETEMTENSQEQ